MWILLIRFKFCLYSLSSAFSSWISLTIILDASDYWNKILTNLSSIHIILSFAKLLALSTCHFEYCFLWHCIFYQVWIQSWKILCRNWSTSKAKMLRNVTNTNHWDKWTSTLLESHLKFLVSTSHIYHS